MKKNLIWIVILLQSFVFATSEIVIETRELGLKSFPCMKCHAGFDNDKAKLPLTRPHDEIKFDHMVNITNCYQCHDRKNRNILVLQTGEKISFDESYRQCFQCHGEKKRDWELGTHGKTVGSWSGKKYKSSCTSCHEPHSPTFRQMKADPGPVHPNRKNNDKGAH